MAYDWVVVGAGLTGATFAERLASQAGARVLVIDRRPHVAGNAHDFHDRDGILVHAYGAHIFHTTSERVWAYLSGFTRWRPYVHRVIGSVDGRLVPIPFNLTTLHALLPQQADRLERCLLEKVGPGGTIPVLRLLEEEDPELRTLGEFVYEKIFVHYSAKQWGLRPEELDRSVTGRIPIVVSHDDRYFHERHQGIPLDGYTAMVQRMLDHPGITVETGVDFRDLKHRGAARTLYTGPVDELFDFRHGPLPYRSLRFESTTHHKPFVQPAAVINFPDERPYTRTLEHKHLTGQIHSGTVVTTEFPQAHRPGQTEPYYPVPTRESRAQYQAYAALVQMEFPGMLLAGRLADYRYYNMDQAVNRALTLFRTRNVEQQVAAASTG